MADDFSGVTSNMTMKVRLLKKSDIKEAAGIVSLNYSRKDALQAQNELGEMFSKSPIKPNYFVAEDGKEIVGFGGFIQSWMDYSVYEIFWINVLPNRQKQGIGKMIVKRIIEEIKKKKDAFLILLAADEMVGNPAYYKKNFKFKVLESFSNSTKVMSLKIK